MSTACWVLINTIHYHDARMRAYAGRAAASPAIVELTNTDVFKPLEYGGETTSYRRYTLFPGVVWHALDKRLMARSIWQKLEEIRPSVVCLNGWSVGGAIAALSWCRSRGVPAVVMSESTAYDHPRKSWQELVKRRIIRNCAAALVGGEPHVQYMMDLGMPRDRIFLGYDVVDNDHFARGAEAARARATELRRGQGLPERFFLASARFEEKKNLAGLIRAYAQYREQAGADAWKLVILGDGHLMPQLRQLREELGLEESVRFPGFKGYAALPTYYGLAGAFVHASTTEQWGLVVNEAMASGLPVLVSNRCGCAPDLVQHGTNGFVFDPNDAAELARYMLRVAQGPEEERQRMAEASRTIIDRWTPETFAQGLHAAVETALSVPQRPLGNLDRALLRAMANR